MSNTVRKSVPIDEETQRFLQALREDDTREHAAFSALVQGADEAGQERWSEAAALAALVDLGKRALKDKVLEAEYRAMAAEQNDEDHAVRAAVRRGRRLSPRAGQ